MWLPARRSQRRHAPTRVCAHVSTRCGRVRTAPSVQLHATLKRGMEGYIARSGLSRDDDRQLWAAVASALVAEVGRCVDRYEFVMMCRAHLGFPPVHGEADWFPDPVLEQLHAQMSAPFGDGVDRMDLDLFITYLREDVATAITLSATVSSAVRHTAMMTALSLLGELSLQVLLTLAVQVAPLDNTCAILRYRWTSSGPVSYTHLTLPTIYSV